MIGSGYRLLKKRNTEQIMTKKNAQLTDEQLEFLSSGCCFRQYRRKMPETI